MPRLASITSCLTFNKVNKTSKTTVERAFHQCLHVIQEDDQPGACTRRSVTVDGTVDGLDRCSDSLQGFSHDGLCAHGGIRARYRDVSEMTFLWTIPFAILSSAMSVA